MKKNEGITKILNVIEEILIYVIFSVFLLRINVKIFAFLPLSFIYRISIILFGILFIMRYFVIKDKKIVFKKYFIYLVIFYLFLLLITFLNPNTFDSMSITHLADTFVYFFIFFYTALNNKNNNRRFLVMTISFIIICSIISVISLLSFCKGMTINIFDYTVLQDNPLRLSNIWENPNVAGIHAVLCMVIALYYIFDKKINIFFKLLCLIMLVINGLVLYYSNSRTSQLILGLVIICYLYILFRKYVHNKIISSIVLIICFLGLGAFFLYIMKNSLMLRYSSLEWFQLDDRTVHDILNKLSSERIIIWERALTISKGWHIYFGNGIASFDKLLLANDSIKIISTHNLYLDIYISIGITGVILSLIFSFYLFFMMIKNKKKIFVSNLNITLLFLVMAVFIFSLLDRGVLFIARAYNCIFWFALGYLMRNISVKRKSKEIVNE